MSFDLGGGKGYHVYPEALRAAANHVAEAVDLLHTFTNTDLRHTALGPYDLGLPGTATVLMPGLNGAGTVERYDQALQRIGEVTDANAGKLQALTDALQKAASYYEQQDEEFYRRMKKLDGGTK